MNRHDKRCAPHLHRWKEATTAESKMRVFVCSKCSCEYEVALSKPGRPDLPVDLLERIDSAGRNSMSPEPRELAYELFEARGKLEALQGRFDTLHEDWSKQRQDLAWYRKRYGRGRE